MPLSLHHNIKYIMKKIITTTFILALTFNVFAQFPTNGLKARYLFNGNTRDTSGNGNHLYEAKTPVFGTGKNGSINSAYAGLNSQSWVNMGSPSTALTISSWIQLKGTEEYQMIASRGTYVYDKAQQWLTLGKAMSHQLYAQKVSGQDSFNLVLELHYGASQSGTDNFSYVCPKKLGTQSWQHFAVSWDTATRNVDWYINNMMVASQPSIVAGLVVPLVREGTGTFNLAESTQIGYAKPSLFNSNGQIEGSLNKVYGFEGEIDDLCFWFKKLTTNDVANVYNNAPTTRINKLNTIKIQVYPNPTSSSIEIKGINLENKSASIVSFDGKVTNVIIINNTIDVSNLNSGIYNLIIKSETGNIEAIEKFIKN